jgi:hypothetical protein
MGDFNIEERAEAIQKIIDKNFEIMVKNKENTTKFSNYIKEKINNSDIEKRDNFFQATEKIFNDLNDLIDNLDNK